MRKEEFSNADDKQNNETYESFLHMDENENVREAFLHIDKKVDPVDEDENENLRNEERGDIGSE
jgi:hypothetical protein